MILANHIKPMPTANFVSSPGSHEPSLGKGEGVEPLSARRSTQRRAGGLGCKKLSSLSLHGLSDSFRGCSSDAVATRREVEDLCTPFELVVGNDFLAPPHIQAVICPVACATLWDKYTNIILVITKFTGRHFVPGITRSTPFVSPASQK